MRNGRYLLKDFKVHLWYGTEWREQPLTESYMYRSLVEKNQKLYDDYKNLIETTHQPDTMVSHDGFLKILEDIRDNGWKPDSFIRADPFLDRNRIGDGQHRASILLFLDEDIEIYMNDWKVIPVLPTDNIKLQNYGN